MIFGPSRALGMLLVGALCSGCGSGGGGTSPSAPTPGPAAVALSGTWRGPATLRTATPAGHCFADVFAAATGTTQQVTWTITQSGNSITIAETSEFGDATTYGGTSDATGLSATWRSSTARGTTLTCPDGVTRSIQSAGGTVTATVSGNSLNGSATTTYSSWVTAGGAGAGTVTTTDTFVLTRQ